MKKIFITTPMFYPSDKPHLGHAFTTVYADVLKRYYELLNHQVFLLTGSDEHGEKMWKKSLENKVDINLFIDQNVDKFLSLWKSLDIEHDCFYRTNTEQHRTFVKECFSKLSANNHVYQDTWQGYYCVSCEENYSESDFKKSNLCIIGHQLTAKNESSYFLNIKSDADYLKNLFESEAFAIEPSWYAKELNNNFLSSLENLSITRKSLDWGVKVPYDDDYTIYVWVDALLSYLGGDVNNLWDQEDTKRIQIIGKDILRFHAVYWQLLLKFLGKKHSSKLITHGWILVDDKKMSKSLGNSRDPIDLLRDYESDVLRFYLMGLNLYQDNKFKPEDIAGRNNTFLVNLYGNLISRFFGILKKAEYRVECDISIANTDEGCEKLHTSIHLLIDGARELIELDRIQDLIGQVFELIKEANGLIDAKKAWSLVPNSDEYKILVSTIYRAIGLSAFLLSPILTAKSNDIFESLALPSLQTLDIDFFKDSAFFCSIKLTALKFNFFERIKEAVETKN